MLLRERRRIRHRVLGRNRAVGFDGDGEAIIVGALTDARFRHGEVGAAHGIIDRIHAHHVDGQRTVDGMLLRLDVPAALVDVQLAVDFAIVLQREQQLLGRHHRDRAVRFDVARIDRSRLLGPDMQHGLVNVGREHQRQLLQPRDDLMDIFDHAGNRLVLVHHAIEAEGPDGRATERGEEHATQRIAERVAISALERLQAKLRRIRVVLALGHFDQVRPDQPR
jgi:hypothetical protein